MTKQIPEFGPASPDAAFVLRPGGYAVIGGEGGRIAIVGTPEGKFLPGGGCQPHESPEQAVVRETREETGLDVSIGEVLGVADELVTESESNSPIRKRCTFVTARVVSDRGDAGESDHRLQWVSPRVAQEQMTHASQRWAIAQYLAAIGKTEISDSRRARADLVTGVNRRWSDNLVQIVCVLLGIVLVGGGGYMSGVRNPISGEPLNLFLGIVGAVVGAIAGLFLSGLAIMIYRTIPTTRKRRD